MKVMNEEKISLQYIEEVLCSINEDIINYYEETERNHKIKKEIDLNQYLLCFVCYPSYFSCYGIKFMGELIWDSDNDDRQYIEDTNCYESLELHLRNKINTIFNFWSELKILIDS